MDLSRLAEKGGLSSLLAASGSAPVQILPLDSIEEDLDQVRSRDSESLKVESLSILADSIARIGVQEPIIVRPKPDRENPGRTLPGKYVVVCGERRYQASKKAGKTDIPVIVRSDLTPDREQEIRILQVTENAQREDIRPMELAIAVKRLQDLGLQKKDIAAAIGKRKDYMTYLSAMLNLPPFLMNEFKAGHLSESPRTCWEYSQLYEQCPDQLEMLISEYVGDLSDDEVKGCLDRGTLVNFRAQLESMGCNESGEKGAGGGSEASSLAASEDLGQDDSGGDDQDRDAGVGDSDPSDEYPDREEREHSAEVGMAPARQGDDSYTAGLGKPDFTDSDTRAERDLSDGLERAGDRDQDIQTGEPERFEGESGEEQAAPAMFRRFYVTWKGVEFKLTQIRGEDDDHVMIESKSGERLSAPIAELQLARGEL